MNRLSEPITALDFITNKDGDSDLLDVDSNRFCTLFHLAVSVTMSPALVILDNSIIGLPSQELQKICSWLQGRVEEKDLQAIVVARSGTDLTPINGSYVIHCLENGKVTCGPSADPTD